MERIDSIGTVRDYLLSNRFRFGITTVQDLSARFTCIAAKVIKSYFDMWDRGLYQSDPTPGNILALRTEGPSGTQVKCPDIKIIDFGLHEEVGDTRNPTDDDKMNFASVLALQWRAL